MKFSVGGSLKLAFRPWVEGIENVPSEGPAILEYVKEAAAENGIDKNIRYGHRVVAADWSDADNVWTVTVDRDGQQEKLTCSFLFACSGYYNYDEGYSPKFEGSEDFGGTIVHPQHWSEDLDYAGKKIVVIGSGATAVSMIPSLAEKAAHVTMLQRSPTYMMSMPQIDPMLQIVYGSDGSSVICLCAPLMPVRPRPSCYGPLLISCLVPMSFRLHVFIFLILVSILHVPSNFFHVRLSHFLFIHHS